MIDGSKVDLGSGFLLGQRVYVQTAGAKQQVRQVMLGIFYRAGIIALTIAVAPVTATAETGAFDVFVRGIKAGKLTFSGTETGGAYKAEGGLRTTGIVSAVAKFTFNASVRGRTSGASYRPSGYAEKSDTGRRKTNKSLTYSGGIPKVQRSGSAKDYWMKPGGQKGTIDPMTATYLLLKARPRDELCKLDLPLYDGARRVQLVLSSPATSGDRITCKGSYVRKGGFSAKELADGTRFPFKVEYAPQSGGLYRVERLDMTTVRGRALFVRR